MKRTILAAALAALTLGAAGSAQAKHLDSQRLVVRGTDTVVDHPCPGGLCIEQTDASFRGTLGTGAYTADEAGPGRCLPQRRGRRLRARRRPDHPRRRHAGPPRPRGRGDPPDGAGTGPFGGRHRPRRTASDR